MPEKQENTASLVVSKSFNNIVGQNPKENIPGNPSENNNLAYQSLFDKPIFEPVTQISLPEELSKIKTPAPQKPIQLEEKNSVPISPIELAQNFFNQNSAIETSGDNKKIFSFYQSVNEEISKRKINLEHVDLSKFIYADKTHLEKHTAKSLEEHNFVISTYNKTLDFYTKNYPEKVNSYKATMKKQIAFSHNQLGVAYFLDSKPQEAAQHFQELANMGYEGAQFNLGICHYEAENFTEAAKSFGSYVYRKPGVTQWPYVREAEKSFISKPAQARIFIDEKAAQAHFYLGLMRFAGIGVETNVREARRLLVLAQERGFLPPSQQQDAVEKIQKFAYTSKHESEKTAELNKNHSITGIANLHNAGLIGAINLSLQPSILSPESFTPPDPNSKRSQRKFLAENQKQKLPKPESKQEVTPSSQTSIKFSKQIVEKTKTQTL